MKDSPIILKYVLQNALNFNGTANPKVVLGQVLKEMPGLKADVPNLMKEIESTVKETAKLDLTQIKEKLNQLAPELLSATEKPIDLGGLKPLPQAKKGALRVRIAPSPSGPLHIGHAYGASLNFEYAKMYAGKLILRIEDTNPENIYPPAYSLIEKDSQWLTDNGLAQVVVQSSRLGVYYDYAEKLIGLDKAYVCTCDPDLWRELKNDGKACPCRSLKPKQNSIRYAQMFGEFGEGEAVLRLKTDIQDKNPAMRDFAILRINQHVHPRTKTEQRVWPLMVFSVAIDDHELGITHVLNGKDHADNAKKEALIMKYLGLNIPQYKHWGRINFLGLKLSTSQTRLAIEQGEYNSWEDIRLPFLPALRRRGYQPGAFRRYALEIGLSLNDKTVPIEEFWKNVNSFNKEIVEPKANRYFFVDDPKTIKIVNAPSKKVELDLHPDFPKRGRREIQAIPEVNISNTDYQRLMDPSAEKNIHRLMDCCNFQFKNGQFKFVSEDYNNYKNNPDRGLIMHWLPVQKNLPQVEVLLDNGTTVCGLGEEAMNCLKEGQIVQLERRYFARVDKIETSKKNTKIKFWYLHK
ncbi:MAG TPA: glutamate--tRNA ligase [Candidatus Nanoarchaeia archaeon]|nr:glutamate--tRNA ligase [Candidatus Nanoarchaeia archaeon]